MKRFITKAAVAIMAVVGLTLGASVPAQAVTYTKYSYCPTANASNPYYGWRSATTINTSGGFRMWVYDSKFGHLIKSGWWGGGTKTIYSGAEDARFVVDPGSSAVYSWSTSCYWQP